MQRPLPLAVIEWVHGRTTWRGELMTVIESEACSETPELRKPIKLTPAWWKSLRMSLDALASYGTDQVSTRQDLISRRLTERYGRQVDPVVEHWCTAHGDLHWSNLTKDGPYILDWECWGAAPRGLDAAFLRCFSLLVPDVERAVLKTFADCLGTSDGVRSQLFACAELLRVSEIYGEHPDLAPRLHALAKVLLTVAPRSGDRPLPGASSTNVRG